MSSLKNDQSGFTIVELLIATVVFSTVLLMMTMGIIQVSRLYIKGYTVSETQNTTRAIVDNVTQAIQTSQNSSPDAIYIPSGSPGWFCINGSVYIYSVNVKLTAYNNVFYVEKPSGGCSATVNPSTNPRGYPCDSSTYCQELLADDMRLTNISLQEVDTTNQLYQFSIGVEYGTSGQNYQPGTHSCYSITGGGEFCSYVTDVTTVQQRVGTLQS